MRTDCVRGVSDQHNSAFVPARELGHVVDRIAAVEPVDMLQDLGVGARVVHMQRPDVLCITGEISDFSVFAGTAGVGVEPIDRHPLNFETALTPAAVTALIDRLEARGLVRQRPDTRDRRKVLVEATDKTHDLILETYAPTARAGLELLASYSLDELATIRHFLEEVLALQQRMTAVLLERGGSKH